MTDDAIKLAHSNLLCYAAIMWPGYKIAPHHSCIAAHLEAVERGDIRRLIILAPPRHGKTQLVSEFFAAWYMGRNPDRDIIFATYSQDRADDVGPKVRDLLKDPIHRSIFPYCQISEKKASTRKIATLQGGNYFSVGRGASITGRGANCLAAGTKVETSEGPRNIEDVVADIAYRRDVRVLSYNHFKEGKQFRRVEGVRIKSSDNIYELETNSGKKLRATWNHEICIEDKFSGYKKIKYIKNGDTLIFGEKILSVKKIDSDEILVYDIQVEGNHNFFAEGILVHNCLVLDDVIKDREEAESEGTKRKLKDWFKAVVYTRLMPNNAIVLIQTSWALDDLGGWLIDERRDEGWTILRFPAICDDDDDPIHRKIGEPLWPEHFPLERLEQIKRTIGTREWSAQYQQRPILAEDGIININWFKRYDKITSDGYVLFTNVYGEQEKDKIRQTVQSWDTAFKAKELSDPSVCTTWRTTKRGYCLVDVFTDRLEYPELRKKVIDMDKRYNPDAVLIENRASGQSLIQELRGATSIPIIPIEPTVDKIVRMSNQSAKLEAGKVFLPHKALWLVDYELEMGVFPYGKFVDQVDSTSQFLAWMTGKRYRKKKRLFWK